MDMSKYKGMFLSEAREHLQSMSQLVVTVEKAPSDRQGIDALFREAHSIKGMAASMGYERTAALAHHLEDLMDGFRKEGEVPAGAVDRLLSGIDLLEALLEDIDGDRPERDVASFLDEPAPPPAPAETTTEAAETPLAPPLPAAPPAAGTLRVTVTLAAEAVAPAARALLALRELAGLGTVEAAVPAEADLLQGAPAGRLEVRLRTGRAPAEVAEALRSMPDVAQVEVAAGAAPAPPPRARRQEDARTVRVRTGLLDRLVNLTGELITSRYMLQTAAREARWGEVREGLDRLARMIADLHGQVLQVRMMPLGSITGRLPRLVRDLCRRTGKQVELRVSGEEVELDRAILEELADPLVHMVRNAVDHGIERTGKVTVRAWREKDQVLLEVADDGRGIDPEVIRRKAVEKGLLTAGQARSLRDREALLLVCRPGFSTAAEVTETSGRGVGMDVVKAAVESLGGTLDIDSEPGRGTRILLRLPLSVAIIQVLLVECGGHVVGIPVTRVLRTLEVGRAELRRSGRQLAVLWTEKAGEETVEEAVPLLSLPKILGLAGTPMAAFIPVVVTEARGRKVGLVVDRLAGQREAFVKTLAFPLDRLPGVSGATVLGDGSVVFIIDPQPLLEEPAGPAPAAGERPWASTV